MSIVNFAIPQILEKRVEQTIRNKGFASRAELFRFAVIRYMDEEEILPLSGYQNIATLSKELGEAVKHKIGKKKLPNLKQQMGGMKHL